MRVAVIGTGYVGLVTGICLSEVGNTVVCFDIDKEKIGLLQDGQVPIYEPGLKKLLKKNQKAQRLQFNHNFEQSILNAEIIIIAVGTPPNEDGSADLSHVLTVAKIIGENISNYALIVTKSTVPVGTGNQVKQTIQQALNARQADIDFDIASNPEFLKEGAAIQDFMYPDRIVIGCETEKAAETLKELYAPFNRSRDKMHVMDMVSSELTKYASNCILATKISLMNEIANVSDQVGANITQVRLAMGADPRIGHHFIYPGVGYGGSCFPKDVRALIHIGQENQCNMDILAAVETVNQRQKSVLFKKISTHYSDLQGKTITIWGLSFKPNTDDVREAPSLVLIEQLLQAGAHIKAFCPKGMPAVKAKLGKRENITFCSTADAATADSDGLALVTEWKQFWSIDFATLKEKMRSHVIFDGRNIWNPEKAKNAGFSYYGIGLS
ncbi:UDP-glucose dehydrogenase family protein [Marinicella sp. W31]|uniref:UDP-glucose dehydrogenase family protein n=1 Tax=Marinicella sp. W31 TaxID=3023713 RepID=UPI0037577240